MLILFLSLTLPGLSRFRVVRVLQLILYIVFDIVFCHYLLLYIRIALVFRLILYIAYYFDLTYAS